MFSHSVLPSLLSLFSSTNDLPLQLFSEHTDSVHVKESFIHLLVDDDPATHSQIRKKFVNERPSHSHLNGRVPLVGTETEGLIMGEESGRRRLCQTVLHIQSPTLPSTYIRCPPLRGATTNGKELGLTLPCMHMQVRTLGREWVFECGVADRAGRKGVIRFSTFKKGASLKVSHSPPLLHIPLRFPQFQMHSHALTPWSTVDVDFRSLIPQFQIVGATQSATQSPSTSGSVALSPTTPLPSGAFGQVTYVKVYATCRLRRIWFSEGPSTQNLPWEFELYGS